MKVHVTGGKGFIGARTAQVLAAAHTVSVSDLADADVRDTEALTACFDKHRPDAVVHLAGLMGAGRSRKDTHDYFAVNAFGVLNMLEAARRTGVRRVVFLSSLTVHGADGPGGAPQTESSPFAPRHPYATGKVIGEYLARDFAASHRMQIAILRPTIITGNVSGEDNAVNEFVRCALADRPIVLFGPGEHRREFLSVRDTVAAIDRAVAYLETVTADTCCEAFIISSGRPVSLKAVAEASIRACGGGCIVHQDPGSVQAFSLTGDPAKAARVLGWAATDGLDDLIAECAAQYRAAGAPADV